MSSFLTPVAIVVFNRPDRAEELYRVLKKIQPEKLYIISDGPRNQDEAEIVEKVRQVFEKIDWKCDIQKNYSKVNLGCDERIITGLDWVFETATAAIILEDDCYPDESFFPFCNELLEKYEKNNSISYISGTNIADISKISDSYYFSYRSSNWGWATWADRWKSFDRSLDTWNCVRNSNVIYELYPPKIANQITDEIVRNFEKEPYPWDFLWWVDSLSKKRLSITPKKNLILNNGFASNATHTMEKPFFYNVEKHKMEFPMNHPAKVCRNEKMEFEWLNLMVETLKMKIKRKMGQLKIGCRWW